MRPSHSFRLPLASMVALCAMGCTKEEGRLPGFLVPCDDPAPLSGGVPSLSTRVLITLREGVDTEAEATRLQNSCDLADLAVNIATHEFSARLLDIQSLGCLRCDPVVVSLEVPVVYLPGWP